MHKFNQEKMTVVFFLVFLTMATLLRFYALDKEGLRYDELHSIIPTHPDKQLADVIEYSKGDQPPLFFVTLHGWFQVFPYNEASGKALCALFGVLGTCAMFFLGKEVAGRTAGLASMFITSLTSFHIYYSQELRFYSLLFLLATLSFWAFLRFLKNPTFLNQYTFIIISAALLYTHYFALVVVASQAIVFIAFAVAEKRPRSFWLRGLFVAFATTVLFAPWLPVIFGDIQISSFWILETDFTFFQTFTRYFQGWWPLSFKWVLTTLLLLLMSFFVYQIFSAGRTRTEKVNAFIVVSWVILTLLIPFVYSLVRFPMMLDRYTMITLPAVILTIAIGWSWLKPTPVKIITMMIFIVCVTRVMNRYYKRPMKPQYREITQEVINDNKNLLPVYSQHAWHLNYYTRKYGVPYSVLPLTERTAGHTDSLSGFYVIFPEFLTDADKEQIFKSFELKKEFKLFHADAVYYEKHIK
jgi:4-amino-4-deoxy-L-arabinose transferase-like glycosyltransferase